MVCVVLIHIWGSAIRILGSGFCVSLGYGCIFWALWCSPGFPGFVGFAVLYVCDLFAWVVVDWMLSSFWRVWSLLSAVGLV